MQKIIERPDLQDAYPEQIFERPDLSYHGRRIAEVGQQAAQGGAVDAVTNFAGLLDFLLSKGLRTTKGPILEQGVLTDAARRGMEALVGTPPEPRDTREQVARRIGTGVFETIPTLPLGGGVAMPIAKRAALETASNIGSELAAGTAKDAGAGPWVQAGAGMAAGAGIGALGAVAKRGTTIAAQSTTRGARKTAERKAAEILQREIPDRTAAKELLDAEVQRPGFGRATTAQVLGDDAPGLFALEKAAARSARSGRDLSRDIARLRRLNRAAAQEEFGRTFPAGNEGAAKARWLDRSQKFSDRVSSAWRGLGNIDGVPTTRLKEARAFVLAEAGDELADSLPKRQLDLVAKYGDSVDLRSMRRLRSAITTRIRGAARDPERAQEVFFLEKLKGSIDETFDDVARASGTEDILALRRAIGLRREKGLLFGPKKGASEAFGEYDDLQKGFRTKILGSRRPKTELIRLKLALGDSPEAWAGVQRLMRNEIFGDGFDALETVGGIKKARRLLARHRGAFDVVYGQGASRNAERFLDRVSQLQRGVVGTAAESAVTGSNVANFDVFASNASIISAVARGDLRGAAATLLARTVGTMPKTALETDVLLSRALIDPEVAAGLLDPLPRLELSRTAKNVQRFAARPVRSFAGTTGQGDQP